MNVLSENDKQYHRVKVKLRTARNSQTNYQYWERTNQVIGKFNRTFKLKGNYLDKDTSENGVLKTTSFKGQLLFLKEFLKETQSFYYIKQYWVLIFNLNLPSGYPNDRTQLKF